MLDCFSSNWIPSCAEFIDVFNHSSCFRSMKIDLFDAFPSSTLFPLRRFEQEKKITLEGLSLLII